MVDEPTVCAVVSDRADALGEVLAAQTQQPQAIVDYGGGLSEGLARGRAANTDWVWVLDGSAMPEPGALAAALAAIGRVGRLPRPVLLASLVLDSAGGVAPGRASMYRRSPTDLAMLACARALLPIRASSGPLLVHRDALAATAPRTRLPPPGDVLEWSARLLRSRAGYLVPASRTVANPARLGRAAAALVVGSAFEGADRARVALELLERRRSSPMRQAS
jgi:hypothetical protein